jgi:glycosyltransferase involved in cell wall biosynthesis
MSKNLKNISIIVPMFNEEKNIPTLMKNICDTMKNVSYEYEVICINDGSTDGSLEELKKQREANKNIKIINFSRNFGKENAVKAGIDFCNSDAAICIDADLQEPPEVILEMIKKWEEGYNSVYAVRKSRESDNFFKKATAYCFYRIYNKIVRVKIPKDTGDFRLFDKKIINILKNLNEHSRFNKGLFSWVGFKQTYVTFKRKERFADETKFNLIKLFNFALDGITGFSHLPLRVWSFLGSFILLTSVLYSFFALFKSLLFGASLAGTSWIIILLTMFSGLQFIAIGIIGEYLGRLALEVKNRPLYITDGVYGFDGENSPKK